MVYERFKNDELILRDLLARDRTVLANERTLLSYVRTAFGFAAGGVTLTQLPEPTTWMFVVAAVLLVAAGLIMAVGFWRFRKVRSHLRTLEGSGPASAAPPPILANETKSH